MTHPAVQYVLDSIKTNWQAGDFDDVPLDRVDGDNNQILGENIRTKTQELQDNNYVTAAYVGKTADPIGTEYDLDIDATVRVRVAGLHHSEHGLVDPEAEFPPSSASSPVPFNDVDGLVGAIKDALYADRTFPDVAADYDEKSVIINNEPGPLSYEYGDYYLYEFEALIDGFEEL